MKAAWYEEQGTTRDVLTVGEMDEPQPLQVKYGFAFPLQILPSLQPTIYNAMFTATGNRIHTLPMTKTMTG